MMPDLLFVQVCVLFISIRMISCYPFPPFVGQDLRQLRGEQVEKLRKTKNEFN